MRKGIVELCEENNCFDNWEVYLDGKETSRIKKNLNYMSEDEKFETILTAAKILSNCPSPNSSGGKKTGLAIGKIQSGKTSNFISLMALAFDNNYNIIVVFGGTKNNLLSQTEERIRKMFDIDNNKRDDRDVVVLSTTNKFDSISPEQLNRMYNSGRKIIIVALKHQKHIKNVKSYITDANLDKKPILLIDDEGDQASLNAKVVHNEKTVIYNELLQLKEGLNHVCFISITATPQANLLIDTIDSLSPDFCQLVEPGKEYTGGSMFHGDNQDFYVIELPEDETEMLEGDGVPESFYNSLGVFFVGSIIRKFRNDGKNHVMLIHPSQKKFDHKEVEKKVNLILENWLNSSEQNHSENGYQKLSEYLKYGYDELSRTVDDMPEFQLILDNINDQLNDSRVLVVNSDKNTDIDYYKTRNIIIVGGNLVERGLTINDLAVTYIVRRSKSRANADVVEQRARWFGYRKKYFDLCRVYCTKQIKEDFSNLLSHEDDIWGWIKYCKKNNIRIKDMPRLFELDNNLNPTRKAVVPNVDEIKFGIWTEQKKININKNYLLELNNAWNDLLSKYEYNDVTYGNLTHRKYIKIPLSDINAIISKYYINDIGFNYKYPYAVEQRNIQDGANPCVTVLKMRIKSGEERSFDDNNSITSNLMQGHSQNRYISDPLYYPGDRYICLNETQLQIHLVHPRIKDTVLSDIIIPMIAFYSPVTNAKRIIGRL